MIPPQELFQRIVAATGGNPQTGKCLCPGHDDQDPSLDVEIKGEAVLWHCRAGCSQEAVTEALKSLGVFNRNGSGPAPAKSKRAATNAASRKSEAPPPWERPIRREYEYTDADGTALFRKVRFADDLKPKYAIVHPLPLDAPGRWKAGAFTPVLYNRPALARAKSGACWVFVVEGEGDVESLRERGILATTNPAGASLGESKWRPEYTETLRGMHVAILQDNDAAGRRHARAVAAALNGAAETVKLIELPGLPSVEGADVTNWFAAGRDVTELQSLVMAAPRWVPPDPEGEPEPDVVDADRKPPVIRIEAGRLPGAVDAAEAALLAQPEPMIYQRAGMLARVVTTPEPTEADGIRRPAGAVSIASVPTVALAERLGRVAQWEKWDARQKGGGGWRPADVPKLVADTLANRGEWALPLLAGVIETPTLRGDGSILSAPGYDPASCLFYAPTGEFPDIPEQPSQAAARGALDRLCAIVTGFPFDQDAPEPEHGPISAVKPGARCASRSVALAAMLTALVRQSLPSAPLFAITAPMMGSGKSLLADVVAILATGREAPAMSQATNPDEDRKRLVAVLMAADPVLLIDNAERPVAGDSLCSVLTQSTYQDRVLGVSERVRLPTRCTILLTGNNLQINGDLVRRTLLCTIDPQMDNPEARRFDGDLREQVRAQRGELVRDALTVLRAYQAAGRPDQDLTPYGGFERWSALVRSALVWLGEPDPNLTRKRIDQADPEQLQLDALLKAWAETFPGGQQATIRDAINAKDDGLTEAMMAIAPDKGNEVNTRSLGRWIRNRKRRRCTGQWFEPGASVSGVQAWRVMGSASEGE